MLLLQYRSCRRNAHNQHLKRETLKGSNVYLSMNSGSYILHAIGLRQYDSNLEWL